MDGFPRTINQAKELDEVLKKQSGSDLKVVNLDVARPILYARSAQRYICEDCSKTLSVPNYDAKLSKCDCGGRLIKRADDTPEILTQRLQSYDRQTAPLIDYYGKNVKNIVVRSEDVTSEEVFDTAVQKLTD